MLCAAAVLGADLDPAAVAAVTGREMAAVLAALDEAAAAGIVVAGPGGASATTWSARRRGWSCRPPTGSPCTPGWVLTCGDGRTRRPR